MSVAVMYIRVVRVTVKKPVMTMWVTMRLFQRYRFVMLVLVVFVMNMDVIVLHRLMKMLVLMMLSQMQPDTNPHESCCNQKIDRQFIPKN